jgi:hypothetical protein
MSKCCEKGLRRRRQAGCSGGLSRFESDLVAEVLDALDEPVLQALAATLVEVLDPEVLVDLAAAEEVVHDDEDGVAESNRGLLLAAPGGEPTILGSEVRAPATTERMGRFDQSRP